jgi:hypothetical protein
MSSISAAGEADWYKFLTGAAGTYTVQTYGSLDMYMYLYASDQTTLIEEDDDDGEGYNSLITRSLAANTWYCIKTRAYSSTATGSYSINVKTGLKSTETESQVDNISKNGNQIILNSKAISIYPNPASAIISVVLQGDFNNMLHMEILSLSGQKLFVKHLEPNQQINENVDIREFPSGLYILNIVTSDGVITSRFIKE